MINLELSAQIAGSFLGDLCDPSVPIPPAQIAQQGDGDIVLVLTIIDGNTSQPVDLSAATPLAILIKKPDLTAASYPASLTTNGKDGRISVALDPADLDQAGYYFVQGLFSVLNVAKSTVLGKFKVGEAIVPTPEEP